MGQGLVDFMSGRMTVPACLVSIGWTRLRRTGWLPQSSPAAILEPERQLYRLLRAEGGDAYSRYNSLVRELVSFEQSLEHETRRLTTPAR